jgi:hypothetical protein
MANYNLTNQDISASFQQILQKNDDNGYLVNGTGSIVEDLTVSGSISASYFVGDGSGLTNLPTGSDLPAGVVSGSSQVILQDTTGDLSGSRITGSVANADNALEANQATLVNITATSNNNNYPIMFVSSNGFQAPRIDTEALGLYYNPSTNRLTTSLVNATTFTGNLVGNASTATSASYAVTASYSLNADKLDGKDSTQFATTGSNTFNGDQTINGDVTASSLRIENNTHLDGTLRVTNDTLINGDVTIQSATPNLKLRDTSGGGFSSGYDVKVDTGSFEIFDDTHDRNVLSDIFNPSTSKHTTSLTSEIIVISGSDSVTIQGKLTASLQEGYAWVGNGSGVTQQVPTSSFGTPINTGSFATTGSNSFDGVQYITGDIIQLSGNFTNIVGGNIQTSGGNVAGSTMGYTNGSSVITGSFSGNGSGLTNVTASNGGVTSIIAGSGISIDQGTGNVTISSTGVGTGYATTGSNSFVGDQIFPSQSAPNGLVFQTKDGSGNNVDFGFGIRNDGQLALTGSNPGNWSSDGLLTISPNNGWMEFSATTTNFNNAVSLRGYTEIRTLVQQLDNGYYATFDKLNVSGSTYINTLTASLEEGYVWVGDSSGKTTTVSTGSFGGGGGSTFPYTGNAEITGSLGVSNTVTSQIFINPQTITGTQTVPAGYNGMLTGPVSNAGTIVVETGSTLVII